MDLKDIINYKKEEIATLFCSLYGEQFYPFFLEKLNQITFLFPNIYQEDQKQYFYELEKHPDNLHPVHHTILLDYLQNGNYLGEFLPMIRRSPNENYISKNFIIFYVSANTKVKQNLDVILLHELKHYFTYHFAITRYEDYHLIINTKVGLSRVVEWYQYENIIRQMQFFDELNEIFTELDAEILAQKLHETSEIFPSQRFQRIEKYWFQHYFSIFRCLSSNDYNLLHQIELNSCFDKMVQLEEEKILYPLEEKIYFENEKQYQRKKKQLNYFNRNRKK